MDGRMRGLPAVLAYHKVGTPEVGGTWCTRQQFRAHLTALAAAGWNACDVVRFESWLHTEPPAAAAPARQVLFTFDDGYVDFATHAWPELQKLGWPALLFVVTDFVGRRATWGLPLPGHRALHLDWPALRDLVRDGVAIGSHAATHRDLRRVDARALERELAGSRAALEDALGIAIHSVAYPFGRTNACVQAAAREAGYTLGFSMCPHPSRRGPLALPRSGVYIIDTRHAVLDKVDASRRFHSWQRLVGCAINGCAELAAWHSAHRRT
jgi:peptidoglycan/xylan/chitin deacetylase (PgdA/CDA1 family)